MSSSSARGWRWSKQQGDYYRYDDNEESKTYGSIIWGRARIPEPDTTKIITDLTQRSLQNISNYQAVSYPSSTSHPSSSSGVFVSSPKRPFLSMEPARISKENLEGPAENDTEPDSLYEEIQRPTSFFRQGRIFRIKTTDQSVTSPSQARTLTLIIAKNCGNFSICVPVHTYGGRATTQDGIDANTHAPLVKQDDNVQLHPHEAPLRLEKLSMIAVEDGPNIGPMARINFKEGIEFHHDYKVRSIGRLDPESQDKFEVYLKTITGLR